MVAMAWYPGDHDKILDVRAEVKTRNFLRTESADTFDILQSQEKYGNKFDSAAYNSEGAVDFFNARKFIEF
jgi:hypothetical protein